MRCGGSLGDPHTCLRDVSEVWVDRDYTPTPRPPETCGKCQKPMILRHYCEGVTYERDSDLATENEQLRDKLKRIHKAALECNGASLNRILNIIDGDK